MIWVIFARQHSCRNFTRNPVASCCHHISHTNAFIDNLHAWRMGAEPIFTAPSHPTQLYEAACYLVTFAICMWLYFKKEAWKKQGLIFGVFMICVFGSRFFIEFVKNDQEPFEAGMMLNMGQWLSIPFVLAGCWFVWRALRNGKLKIEN